MSGEDYYRENHDVLNVRFLPCAFCNGAEHQRNYHKHRHCGESEVKALDTAEKPDSRRTRKDEGLVLLL